MKWISTNEKLPESQNEYFLIYVKKYGVHIAMFSKGKWYSNYISKITKKVTHWMEIKDPVEKEVEIEYKVETINGKTYPTFSIGNQTFQLVKTETVEDAEWFLEQLKKAISGGEII